MYCAKLAILLQIQRIFVTDRNSIRFLLLQLMIWINGAWYFSCIWLSAFPCSPRPYLYNKLLDGHCAVDLVAIDLISIIFNVVSDILILMLPIRWLWDLQMANGRKIGISLIFATGIL